jgi:uncharacterized phage-associated protein
MPVSAHDVAKYILKHKRPMTPMKLQKLLYYCQAWSLVWDSERLFDERIEAWAFGPVVPAVFREHKGEVSIDDWALGNASKLDETQRETVDAVLGFYGDKSGQWLSDLTHSEWPWQEAREGLGQYERSQVEISLTTMEAYYSSLPPNGEG